MHVGEPAGDFDFAAALAEQRRMARRAARDFAEACRRGDIDGFYLAAEGLDLVVDGWRLAMLETARSADLSPEIKDAFLAVWIESKMLPLRVAHRRTLSNALRRILPLTPIEAPMRLYRGAGGRERRFRLYGFSWSSRIQVARQFAENWAPSGEGGVVLETVAPPPAVLLVREEEGYYDEGEVVVDPFQLGRVSVVKRLK